MPLKRKVCTDCHHKQGSHTQWLNNQKLCAAHTGASDAVIACLSATNEQLRALLLALASENAALIPFVETVHNVAIRTMGLVNKSRKP
jgi:hypothetical protein